MKILFVIRSVDYVHYYRSIIETLGEHEHIVKLAFDRGWSRGANLAPLKLLVETYPNISWEWAPRRGGWWRSVLFTSRELRTYRRFLLNDEQSVYYRDRWLKYVPWFVRGAIKYIPGVQGLVRTGFAESCMAGIERTTKPAKNISAYIREKNPDLVIATPLNQRFSEDIEYVKAAQALGIKTAGSVLSWDNLTTKGLIHVWPDLLLVWNETQVKEAWEHHGIPEERTRIIGAPVFDQWFSGMQPSSSREGFCKTHDIDPTRPYLLYLGSSRNISHNETWVVEKIRKELDSSSDERTRAMQIVVRPHGSNYAIYEPMQIPGVVVVPKKGTLPSTNDAFQLSYDSMYFAEAVAGINTSAMIEAMIIGKPIFAMMIDQYRKTQLEAQHFRQLLDANALVLIHTDTDLHREASALLDGHDHSKAARTRFIEQFIRPKGAAVSAGKRAVEVLESWNTK